MLAFLASFCNWSLRFICNVWARRLCCYPGCTEIVTWELVQKSLTWARTRASELKSGNNFSSTVSLPPARFCTFQGPDLSQKWGGGQVTHSHWEHLVEILRICYFFLSTEPELAGEAVSEEGTETIGSSGGKIYTWCIAPHSLFISYGRVAFSERHCCPYEMVN